MNNIITKILFHNLEISLVLKKPLLIYVTKITPRLEYSVRLIFEQILGLEIRVVDDTAEFRDEDQPRINYSSQRIGTEPFVKADTLLFNTDVVISPPDATEDDGITGFFPVSGDSLMRFDPLASVFYTVTRMEEYTSGERDIHGRFPAKKSILYQLGILGEPIVNRWALLLFKKLRDFYPYLELPAKAFSVRVAIDIDNAWAYRGKGWMRTSGSILRDIIHGKWSSVSGRLAVLTGRKSDPYDTYDYLFKTLEGKRDQVLFFLHVGNYGRFDRPVSWKKSVYRQLIREVAMHFRVGIHPSYLSSSEGGNHRVMTEKERLSKIIGSEITCSRQHYLRLNIPETYRTLIQSGITEDYSMGYAEITGFRAGICTPFRFYDLTEEKETSLTVYPVPVMDVTLRNYMGLSAEEASMTMANLMQEIQNAGGVLVVSWHNESLTNEDEWKDYRIVFEQVLTGDAHDKI